MGIFDKFEKATEMFNNGVSAGINKLSGKVNQDTEKMGEMLQQSTDNIVEKLTPAIDKLQRGLIGLTFDKHFGRKIYYTQKFDEVHNNIRTSLKRQKIELDRDKFISASWVEDLGKAAYYLVILEDEIFDQTTGGWGVKIIKTDNIEAIESYENLKLILKKGYHIIYKDYELDGKDAKIKSYLTMDISGLIGNKK